ncbi:nucleotidyltransferase domain-containing protein [Mastigocladopsis repens]|uniref:nucleotidyltransferase domain-containing protein n=1 Tax=Mastigocladopsis repens TaxID=221287 RepID=UPI0002DC26DC|nr:nucleotidyltransferase family protein [Mastigocladopsis repens]
MMKTLSPIDTKNQQINVKPEIELLLRCVRTSPNDSTIERIKALVQEDIDWEYLIQTAYRNGVIPLLHWSLSKICPQSVPATFQQQLQYDQYVRTQRSLILTNKLLKLLELFEANNIPVIPFKGPILAISAYGDIARRDFYDLDILVRKQDFLKTKELLADQGYQPYSNSNEKEATYLSSLKPEQQKAYLQSHWELHLVDERDRVTVDLHHGILPKQFSFLFDTEWIWEDAQLKPFANKKVLHFALEDLILILCSQGAKDCWLQMNRICDIAQLIRTSDEIDWERVCERAAKLRMTRILLLGLLLTHNLLEVELPKTILQQIQASPLLESLASQIYIQLFTQTNNSLQDYKIKSFFFHLRLIEHPLDKVWYCFEHLIVPTIADQVFLPLPKHLSFLYYLLRPIRLIRTYLLPLVAPRSS